MKHDSLVGPIWATASFGQPPFTSPLELHALGEHLHLCQHHSGRIFALRCSADTVHSFVATRFVTTLVLLVFALCVGLVIW